MELASLRALCRSMAIPEAWLAPPGPPRADGLYIGPDGEDPRDGPGLLVAWLREGRPRGRHLRLWPRARAGVTSWPEGSGGTPDSEVYRGGAAERFDAWSDGAGPHRQPWGAWAAAQARAVIGAPRCALCGAPVASAPIGALSAGDELHVCAGCWSGLGPGALRARAWPLGERRCLCCARVFEDEALMAEGKGGKLCAGCVATLRPLPPRPWWRRWVGG